MQDKQLESEPIPVGLPVGESMQSQSEPASEVFPATASSATPEDVVGLQEQEKPVSASEESPRSAPSGVSLPVSAVMSDAESVRSPTPAAAAAVPDPVPAPRGPTAEERRLRRWVNAQHGIGVSPAKSALPSPASTPPTRPKSAPLPLAIPAPDQAVRAKYTAPALSWKDYEWYCTRQYSDSSTPPRSPAPSAGEESPSRGPRPEVHHVQRHRFEMPRRRLERELIRRLEDPLPGEWPLLRLRGKVTQFNKATGAGFLKDLTSGKVLQVHREAARRSYLPSWLNNLLVEEELEYTPVEGPRGWWAAAVTRPGMSKPAGWGKKPAPAATSLPLEWDEALPPAEQEHLPLPLAPSPAPSRAELSPVITTTVETNPVFHVHLGPAVTVQAGPSEGPSRPGTPPAERPPPYPGCPGRGRSIFDVYPELRPRPKPPDQRLISPGPGTPPESRPAAQQRPGPVAGSPRGGHVQDYPD